MGRPHRNPDAVITGREITYFLLLAAQADPNKYTHPEVKAAIYKAKAVANIKDRDARVNYVDL